MRPPYTKPMRRHYITAATGNAAIGLSMAKEVLSKCDSGKAPEALQELVHVINIASLSLIKICERHASTADETGTL